MDMFRQISHIVRTRTEEPIFLACYFDSLNFRAQFIDLYICAHCSPGQHRRTLFWCCLDVSRRLGISINYVDIWEGRGANQMTTLLHKKVVLKALGKLPFLIDLETKLPPKFVPQNPLNNYSDYVPLLKILHLWNMQKNHLFG